MSVFMDIGALLSLLNIFFVLVIPVIGFVVLYLVIKTAVRNGIIEAKAQTERQTIYEIKKAMYESVKVAMHDGNKDNM